MFAQSALPAAYTPVMLLNLTTLVDDRTPLRLELTPETLAVPADDFAVADVLHFVGELQQAAPGEYRLTGRVTGDVLVPCSRCAEPFGIALDVPVDVPLRPVAALEAADEHEIGDDDLATTFYEDETLDLAAFVREQCYLALPMKPLCRPDCRGLCPHCGTNLNQATCTCDTTWVDPRFAGLKALVPDPSGE